MNSWLLEYKHEPNCLLNGHVTILDDLKTLFDKYLGDGEIAYRNLESKKLTGLISSPSYRVLIQATDNELFTIDIHDTSTELTITEKNIRDLKSGIEKLGLLGREDGPGIRVVPPFKRGREISPYDMYEEKLIEKDHDKVLYSQQSPYQHVKIVNSQMYGNSLLLDNDIQHANREPEYFKAISACHRENYTGKRVLILGGGNGALLQILRHKGVEHVTMIELDQMVCDVSKVYLRDLCHDSLDAPKGDNYDIIMDDCVNPLKRWVEEGRKFDYVFNDIITVPIIAEDTEDYWMFMKSVSKLSMMVLNVGGIYKESQGSVIYSSLIKKYEEQMQDLGCEVEMSKEQFHIPLFHELWNFYTFKKLSNVK